MPKKEITYGGENYPSPFDVPIVTRFEDTGRALYRKNASSKDMPPVIGREFKDGKVFLSYRGVNLVPGADSRFLAKHVAEIASALGREGHFTAVDVGTGTGIFATYLAEALSSNPDSQVIATDISGKALEVAGINFALNGISKPPSLRNRDLLTDIALEFGKVDLVVSNPPYTPSDRLRNNGFEPALANDGGADGMDLCRKLFKQSRETLRADGTIVIQIVSINAARVIKCAQDILPSASIGYVNNPATNRSCGLIIGRGDLIRRFSTGMIS